MSDVANRAFGAWTAAVIAVAASACSSASSGRLSSLSGKVVVVLTIDWEGAELDRDGFDALDRMRGKLGAAPITHFVSAAYLTKDRAPGDAASTIARAIRPGDELAVHLHAWRTLAHASGLEPRVTPSFLSGTDDLVDIQGDNGFETDLDTYDVPALRALLRTSRHLLEQTHAPVSNSFRAGGYLTTPKVQLALGDEDYQVDSSAVSARQLRAGLESPNLSERLAELWPKIEPTTQPYFIRGGAMRPILELPIAAVADYVSTSEIVDLLDSAHARVVHDATRDVFVVLAFHLETATDYAARITDAIASARARYPEALRFVTVEQAAELARFELGG